MKSEITLIHSGCGYLYTLSKDLCKTCVGSCKYSGSFKVSQCDNYKQKELYKFRGWCGKIKN